MAAYSKDTIEKLGNAIVYIAKRVPDLSKTKLLKLIYLLEEVSVKKNKLPFFGIPFEVWQAGPVAKDIFIDLDVEPVMLKHFISVKREDKATYILAKTEFNNDEFSGNDMEVMDYVIDKFGNKTATQLVNYLHKESSIWYRLAKESGLLESFKNGQTNSSGIEIDFTYYLSGCETLRYKDCLEFNNSIFHLKP
jgi:uncharacterized phage-associated protein